MPVNSCVKLIPVTVFSPVSSPETENLLGSARSAALDSNPAAGGAGSGATKDSREK